jgi:hypothetical protein
MTQKQNSGGYSSSQVNCKAKRKSLLSDIAGIFLMSTGSATMTWTFVNPGKLVMAVLGVVGAVRSLHFNGDRTPAAPLLFRPF